MESRTTNTSPRILEHFDRPLFFTVFFLCIIGLATIYSSSYLNQIGIFYRQLIFVGCGLALALVISFLDYRIFERLAIPIYVICLILLVLVDFVGTKGGGAQRWIQLGGFVLQPSEPTKIAVVLMLARFYSRQSTTPAGGYGLFDLWPVMIICGLPMFLIFRQPNLGTTLLVAFISFTIVFLCQLRLRTLVMLALTGIIAAPLAYQFGLKDYQKTRVKTFLNPQSDPLGEGYHTIQSMISTGSGQILGKGYLKGTQSKLEFLPEHHTDFVFSVFAEEWGFVGSIVVMGLYLILLLLGIDIVRKSKDKFGAIMAVGCLAIIMWQVVVNIGMELGLLPVVGVTLPFMSYGGSSMVTVMTAFGILLSVSARRHIF
jgi:rod shape determining protein RodA